MFNQKVILPAQIIKVDSVLIIMNTVPLDILRDQSDWWLAILTLNNSYTHPYRLK